MTLAQIEAAIPGLSKKEMNASINNILRLVSGCSLSELS